MIILRNGIGLNKNGNTSFGGLGIPLLGYQSDTYTFQGTFDLIPTEICRHEFAHQLLGSNNFHCTGNAPDANYWIPIAGGHSMLGGAKPDYDCWNAWDRYRLGWKDTPNAELISARNSSGTAEALGDLDATNSAHAGTYILGDFVITGDALRIKLPFLDPTTEYEQWLWLENHRGFLNNGNSFDQYSSKGTTCIDEATWGLSVSLQIDKEIKTGPLTYRGFGDYYRGYSADGMWERQFDTLITDPCLPWEYEHYPSEKMLENPLTGYGDLDGYPDDIDGDLTILKHIDQKRIAADLVNGVTEYKLFELGNPRQLFSLIENREISMGTNPSSANQMNQVGFNSINVTNSQNTIKNVGEIYLNGIKIEILEMMTDGSIKVDVRFDHVDIEKDVRWCGPDLVLNEIVSPSGYSLSLAPGKKLHIDHGVASTRMDNPIPFQGELIYTWPAVLTVEPDAYINLEVGSELIIDRKSLVRLESGSRIDVQSGATIRIKREGLLELSPNSVINVANGGRIIIEGNDGSYTSGRLKFFDNAQINLNGANAIMNVGGKLELANDAHFNLSSTADVNRTLGKIIFRVGTSTQIIAGSNATFTLQGFQRNQEVILNYNNLLEFPPNLLALSIQDLTVSQEYACRLVPSISNTTVIGFENVHFTTINQVPGYMHYGIRMNGQKLASISNCSFEHAAQAVNATNNVLGFSLKVNDCTFRHCDYGVTAYSRGMNIAGCEFEYCRRPIDGNHLSAPSYLTNIRTLNTNFVNFDLHGVAPTYVTACSIKNGTRGVLVSQGSLYVRCSSIKNQSINALEVVSGASIYMNGAFGYGKNDLAGNPRTIQLTQANILNLHDGFNDLRPTTTGTQNIINGTVICSGSTTNTARSNLWKSNGLAPNGSDYKVTRLCNPTNLLSIIDPSPTNSIVACFVGEPDSMSSAPAGELNENSVDENSINEIGIFEIIYQSVLAKLLPPIISLTDENNIENPSEDTNTSTTELNDGAEVDSDYLNILKEGIDEMIGILVNVPSDDLLSAEQYALASELVYQSFSQLKNPNSEQDIVADSDIVEDLLLLLDSEISHSQDASDDPSLYYTLLRKAQALRMNGEYPYALSTLDEANILESDSTQLVDLIECYLEAELNWTIDSDNSMALIGCDGGGTAASLGLINSGMIEAANSKNQIQMLRAEPNPTKDVLFLTLENEAISSATILIFDMLGRNVHSIQNSESARIDVSALPIGTYIIISYFDNGEIGKVKFLKL